MTTQRVQLGFLMTVLFAMAMFIGAPLQAEDRADKDKADKKAHKADKDAEAKTLTGVIVGVHEYLVTGKADDSDENKDLLSFVAPEAPIALRVDETTLAKKLTPGGTTYLIMFDPNESSSRDVYAEARNLMGKPVAVTGQLHERDGLHAISILGVHTVPEQAAADGDEPQDRM